MPMAGEGSRFKQAGIDIPKPLIKANGIPFFVRALSSIKDSFDDLKVTCIIQSKHDVNNELSNSIKHEIPFANIVVLQKLTNGAVETCLAAKPFMCKDDAILIMDCDLEWKSNKYILAIKSLLRSDSSTIGGLLLSFDSDKPRYSYARIDKDNVVIETAEKSVISNNALVGAYYFNTVDDFILSSDKLVTNNKLSDIKEYYISLLYNYLIQNGRTVMLYKVDTLHSFGTPEELNEYEHSFN
jgi:dTDP-glucose pyrophosphorylase